MARKTAENAELSRLKLLEAGLQTIALHGFAYSTLDEIAQKAGLSRGAVYWHFKGKAELLHAIMATTVLPFEDFLLPGATTMQGFEQLAKALERTLSIQRHRDFCKVLLKEGEVGTADCPVITRWRKAQDHLSVQLHRLVARRYCDAPQARTAQMFEIVELMQLSIIGMLMGTLFEKKCTGVRTATFVRMLTTLLPEASSAPNAVRNSR